MAGFLLIIQTALEIYSIAIFRIQAVSSAGAGHSAFKQKL